MMAPLVFNELNFRKIIQRAHIPWKMSLFLFSSRIRAFMNSLFTEQKLMKVILETGAEV